MMAYFCPAPILLLRDKSRLCASVGGRVFLYRGFTDSELARKGFTPLDFHDVEIDFTKLRSQKMTEFQEENYIVDAPEAENDQMEDESISLVHKTVKNGGDPEDSMEGSGQHDHASSIESNESSVSDQDNEENMHLTTTPSIADEDTQESGYSVNSLSNDGTDEASASSNADTQIDTQKDKEAPAQDDMYGFYAEDDEDDEDDPDDILQSFEYSGYIEPRAKSDYEILSDEEFDLLDTFGRQPEMEDGEDDGEMKKDEAYWAVMETLGVIQEQARDTLPGKKKKGKKRRPYY